MKKLFLSFLMIFSLGFCFSFLDGRTAAAETTAQSPTDWVTAAGETVAETDGELNFRSGTYHYEKPIDLENGGFTTTMSVNGDFRREDSWFAFLLQSERSDAIGKYKGVNVQFKPVSTQGVKAGEMPAYVSTYNIGTAEGGGMASNVATVRCSDIVERETPYRFNFSLFVSDGTFVVAYGIDSYTFKWSMPGVELNDLKLSLIFGGENASTTDMNVTLHKAGEAASERFLGHACDLIEEEDGGTRIIETSKRQGKVFYPISLSDSKEISVKFKINQAPAWFINDGTDAAWLGIMLSTSPNVCLPGSATVGTIIRTYQHAANGTMHVGGQFFYNGSYVAGYPIGTDMRGDGEYTEFIYTFGENEITMTLLGTNERVATIPIDSSSFLSGKVYLSFSFNDDRFASIIEKNEFGEEVGRTPNPDVKYWDVVIGEISEYGAPVSEMNGKNVNVRGNQKAQLPVKLYGGEISEFGFIRDGVYQKIPVNRYAVRRDGDTATIVFTNALMEETGMGEKTFRIVTSHEREKYDGAVTDFTVNFVDATSAEVKVGSGTFDTANPADVKYSFDLKDDAFVGIEGYGVSKNDCFYNPLTGNLYLKREFLKNLSEGNYTFTVQFEYTSLEISLDYKSAKEEKPKKSDEEKGCGSALGGTTMLAAGIAALALVFGKRKI